MTAEPRPPLTLSPDDDANRALLRQVHPPDWINPEPGGKYNLVVLGAGTAGLVTAAVAAALGAKVALVEKYLMGGDCLNLGCVPSKGLIAATRIWARLRRAEEFGLHLAAGGKQDFAAAMARMRRLRARLSHMDSAQRFASLGVEVFLGEGRFTGPDRLEVEGKTLHFARAAICTGGRAAATPIPGLAEAGYLTNESVFDLTELPARLAVIGAGPIGCEMAQTFARFGSRVTLLERLGRILPREDADAAGLVQARLQQDGVTVLTNAAVSWVERRGPETVLAYAAGGLAGEVAVDHVLVGVGRAPNVERMGLEEAGVRYDLQRGVLVNDRLQTSNPRIFAAGDVCSPLKFTHAADAMAQIVIQNALFPHPLGLGYASTRSLVVPWCTYTEPEVAHVGHSEQEAREAGLAVETVTVNLSEVDRAVLDGEEEGFVRLHVDPGSGRILGATIVAAHAGELIGEVSLLMKAGLGLGAVAGAIRPYPTRSEVLKKAAQAWRKTALTPGKRALLKKLFAWMRR